MRAPVVAGVAGGVGTTTVAMALRGHDAGRLVDGRADVVVCRCTGDSLRHAARLADHLGTAGPRPVLAVTADGAVPARGPLPARLRMIEPQFAAVIVLPYVSRWRALTDPLAEATGLLARPAEELPRSLRSYATALRRLATAVAATGRLYQQPSPPRPAQPPAPAGPTRGVRIIPPGGPAHRPSPPQPAAAHPALNGAR